jgi:hypothetical protein
MRMASFLSRDQAAHLTCSNWRRFFAGCGILPYEPVGLWLAGLQIRLRGPYFRRFLRHGTTMARRTGENLSSRSQIFASTSQSPTAS